MEGVRALKMQKSYKEETYITMSIPPSSCTHFCAALFRLSCDLTSTAPIPITLAPRRAVAISLAIDSVFSTLRPMMQASAPRSTRARTWALQILPAPPVQKTTLPARSYQRFVLDELSMNHTELVLHPDAFGQVV